jgi:urea transport system ATP-binding protein
LVQKFIVGLQGQRMAILMCEQYYDFAEELADDYLVMERGEVIAHGPGSEMKAKNIKQLVSI